MRRTRPLTPTRSPLRRPLPAESTVAVSGMGLVALDVVTALTIGRGGRSSRRATGCATCPAAASRDPAVLPQRPSVHGQVGDAGNTPTCLQAAICHAEALDASAAAPNGARDRSTCGASCCPCCSPRCTLRYYAQPPSRTPAVAADGAAVREQLARAWEEGRFEEELAALAARFGPFDAEALFFGHHPKFESSDDYERFVHRILADDLREAEVRSAQPGQVRRRRSSGSSATRSARSSSTAGCRSTPTSTSTPTSAAGSTVSSPARRRCAPPVAGADGRRGPADPLRPRAGRRSRGRRSGLRADADADLLDRVARAPRGDVDVVIRGHLEDPRIEGSASALLTPALRRAAA